MVQIDFMLPLVKDLSADINGVACLSRTMKSKPFSELDFILHGSIER